MTGRRQVSRGLLTREERFLIRETLRDLHRQHTRARTPQDRARLERLMENCKLEQTTDRDARKREGKRSR